MTAAIDETTAQQCNEALRLALQVVERRNGKPIDRAIWKQLLLHAPPGLIVSAAAELRKRRHNARRELREQNRLRRLNRYVQHLYGDRP